MNKLNKQATILWILLPLIIAVMAVIVSIVAIKVLDKKHHKKDESMQKSIPLFDAAYSSKFRK